MQYAGPAAVLQFAKAAINLFGGDGQVDTALVSTLWVYVFRHSLNLGLTDEAFTAMVNIPDEATRRDCLQRLGEYLVERLG